MVFHTDREQYSVDDALVTICQKIVNDDDSKRDWNGTENSDEYQTETLCGGFDAVEQAFCFSYFKDNEEYWFQFGFDEAFGIAKGQLKYLDMRKAET